jgi:hypothetical protein
VTEVGILSRAKYATICLAVMLVSLITLVAGTYLLPYTVVEIPPACETSLGPASPVSSASIHIALWSKTETPVELQRAIPNYAVPGVGKGVLLATGPNSAVVVEVSNGTSFSSTLFLVNTKDGTVLTRISFPIDTLVAAFSGGIAYVYFGGLGYEFNATTGAHVGDAIKYDNYRDVYTSSWKTYIQTDALILEVSSTRGLAYHPDLALGGIAYGCLVPQP